EAQLERQAADDGQQPLDDRLQPFRADDAHRLSAGSVGDLEKDAWQAGDVVGVGVADQDRAQGAIGEVGDAPVHLGALAAVEEDGVALDADRRRRERAVRQRHHRSVSEQADLDHRFPLHAGRRCSNCARSFRMPVDARADRNIAMMTARPTTYAQQGMISTPHYLASQVGLRVLQEGGNAVDAAIAANATLNVVLPNQCHVGGDLFALVWDPQAERLHGLNASGPAPAGASVEQIRAQGHTTMPERGALPVTVPGTVGGWSALLERFGTKSFDELLRPAISYARDGFPMSDKLTRSIEMLSPLLDRFEEAGKAFRPNGLPRAGDILRQPRLAETFERIGREGRDGFYLGPVAADIVRTLQAGG